LGIDDLREFLRLRIYFDAAFANHFDHRRLAGDGQLSIHSRVRTDGYLHTPGKFRETAAGDRNLVHSRR
jgi:hypothetical protein